MEGRLRRGPRIPLRGGDHMNMIPRPAGGQKPPQGVSLSANEAIQLGFKASFSAWGQEWIGHACMGCGASCCEPGEAFLGFFGLRRVGLDVLWFVVHHCRVCDPWAIARGIATKLDGTLV